MKKILGKAETGKLIISGIAVCVDPTGIAVASLGADALIQMRDKLFKNSPGLTVLAKELDKEFTVKLNSPAYDKPNDARQVLPDMLKVALSEPSAFVEHDLDAQAILKTLTDRFMASSAPPDHKRLDLIAAFKKLYGPILLNACNNPDLERALSPAFRRKNAEREKKRDAQIAQIIEATQSNPKLSLEARELARQENLIRKIAANHLENTPEDPLIALEEIGSVLEKYAADLRRSQAGTSLPISFQQALDASHALTLDGELQDALSTIRSAEEAIIERERELQAAKHLFLDRRLSIAALDGRPDEAARIEIERMSLETHVSVSVQAMKSRAMELEEEFKRFGTFFLGLTAKSLLEIAFEHARPEDFIDEVLGQLANATASLGMRVTDIRYLTEAAELYRQHEKMVPRSLLPDDWATVQNNLGNTFQELGTRNEGAAGMDLLAQSDTAYRAALLVRTRVGHPVLWAITQNNLSNTLKEKGIRSEGAASVNLLIQSVAGYRAALEVHTREEHPVDWASAHNNLGIALRNQGIRTEGSAGEELLSQSATAFRDALEVYTRTDRPVNWADTQNNLGTALADQGNRTEGPKGADLLEQSVTAFRAALEVRTRADHPVDWAGTQNNLGNALGYQGKRTEGPKGADLLQQSVTAFRAALEVRTRADHPVGWAGTQENIAITLKDRALRSDAKDSGTDLVAALNAVDLALGVFDPEHMSYDHRKATDLRQQILSEIDALPDPKI